MESGSGTPLRPSATRKNLRVPRSASKSFETPANGGNHWDVSDISIVVAQDSLVNMSLEEEDFDEIEYMPPKIGGSSSSFSFSFAVD